MGPSAHQALALPLRRETRREILDIASSGNEFSYNIFLRAFSLELPLKRPV